MSSGGGWRTWAKRRYDSWYNAVTGLAGPESGSAGVRNRTSYQFVANDRIADQDLEDLYHHTWVVPLVCDVVPDECLRQGFEVVTDGDGDAGLVADMHERLEALHVRTRFADAWTWARLYGGGAVFLGADDGRDMDEPLDERNIRTLSFLTVLDRRECMAFRWFDDPLLPNFGEPELFRLSRATLGGVDTAVVHASRLIRFGGVRTSRRKRMGNNSWSEGVIQRCWDPIKKFEAAWVVVGHLMQDASQGVLAIRDLEAKIASDAQDAFKARMEALDMARSMARSLLIDADGERYERIEANILAGLPALLDKHAQLVAAATRIPAQVLIGQEPAGLNATGDNTIRAWYDGLKSTQVNDLQPRLERLIRLLWKAKDGPSRGQVPPGWRVEFRPLWQPTEGEVADLHLKVAQADQIYLTAQVVTPEEVAISRFRPEGWSAETIVDLQVRHAALEASTQPEGAVAGGPGVNRALPPGATPPPRDPAIAPRAGEPTRDARADHDGERVIGQLDPGVAQKLGEAWDRAAALASSFRADSMGNRGVAIVLPLPVAARWACGTPGDVPSAEQHCTLAFLGAVDGLDDERRALLRGVARAWAARTAPITGAISGSGRFLSPSDAADPVYMTPGSPALAAARDELVRALAAVGIEVANAHGFVPHVTLAYVARGAPTPLVPAEPITVVFADAGLWMGDARETFALTGGTR